MEENKDNQERSEQTAQQPEEQTVDQTDEQSAEQTNEQATEQTEQQNSQEKPKGLMPGQEHEDELDYMGAALFNVIGKGFTWVKNLISPKKVE